MIPTTKPSNAECLIQVKLSQTDNEGNHLVHSYSKFCISVHFSFNQGGRLLFPYQYQRLDLMPLEEILHCSQHIQVHSFFIFILSCFIFKSLLSSLPSSIIQLSLLLVICKDPPCQPDQAPRGPTSMLSPFLPSHLYTCWFPAFSATGLPPHIHKPIACVFSFSMYLLSTDCVLDTERQH